MRIARSLKKEVLRLKNNLRLESEQAVSKHDVLIVMTRFPCAGKNKTRLIPVLGPTGATAIHDRLARHTFAKAMSFSKMRNGIRLWIHLDGGTPEEGRVWLGEAEFHPQSDGDLGKRMETAVELAFSDGASRVVVIGTDCPSIDETLLERAIDSLNRTDLVYGSALDGGYYLVGLCCPCPEIFSAIEWGGEHVLTQSLAAAKDSGLQVSLLEVLSDVDFPEDLPGAFAVMSEGTSFAEEISSLNEDMRLPFLLDRL
jgi:uncharacterized protein